MSIEIDAGTHLRKALKIGGVLVLVIALSLWWFVFRGGSSSSGEPTMNEIPVGTITGPCDDDGCQLWWEYTGDGTWHLHSGTRAAATVAINEGGVLVAIPEQP